MSRICYNCMKSTKDGDFCNHCGKKQSAVPSHQLIPGSVLNGKYTIGYALGEGGFGITYVGLDNSLQIKVAIKEFYPKGIVGRDNKVSAEVSCINAANSESLFITEKSKVINEARILAKFSKEQGIVNVRDYFEANNTAYIVMEYLEGETLEDYLKHTGPLSPENTYNLLYPVMRVVEQLHKENVVHRDISPDNLMFDGKQLKLLDFGAAREVLYSTSKSFSVILKHGYAPEEQYRRKGHQGPWTDIYALCATMYFCMTGEVPDTSLDRLHDDELKPLSECNVSLNKNQELAMKTGLSVLLEGRFKKISEFIEVWNGNSAVIPPEVSPNHLTYRTTDKASGDTVFGGDADYVPVDSVQRFVTDEPVAVSVKPSAEKEKGNGLLIFIIILLSLIIVAGVGILIWKYLSANNDDNSDSENPTTTTTASGMTTTTLASKAEGTTTSKIEIDNFKSYLEEADVLVEEEKFDEAIATLDEAQQLYGEDERVEQKKFEIVKKKGVFQLEIYVSEGDYLNAILYIDSEMPEYNSDEDVVEKRAEFVVEYRRIVIETADKALEDEGYEKAIEIINEAIDVIGEDEELNAKIEEYEEYKPVALNKLAVTSSGDSHSFTSSAKDPRGEINENVMLLEYTVEFYTGGEYSTFNAKLDPAENFETSLFGDTKLYIYADDELVYSSPVITYKTDDLEIEADIKNADYIRLEIENVSGYDRWQAQDILLCDPYVQK